MTGDLRVHWDRLDELFASMEDLHTEARQLTSYFVDHVCDGSGFDYPTCAMEPLGDQLPKIAGAFTDGYNIYRNRWNDLRDGTYAAVKDIAVTDRQIGSVIAADVDHTIAPIYGLLGIELPGLVPLDDLGEHMGDPDKGKARLRHPSKFDDAADAWSTARDIINAGVGFLNQQGANLPTLDKRSLREYVVYPLAANWEKIGANADACKKFASGTQTWAGNYRTVAGRVDLAIEGDTGTALTATLDVYSVVADGIAIAVANGSTVYTAIGLVSEQISVEVEKVLVVMGERLLKTASRVTSKLIPGAGWALTVVDILKNGLAAFTDIINDIVECKKMIDDCLDLVDEIKAWAEVQAEQLHKFHQVLDLMQQLPFVNPDGHLADITNSVQHTEHSVNEIIEKFDAVKGPEADNLNKALDDLGKTTYPDSSSGDYNVPVPDDDESIQAPGPLVPPIPGEPGASTSGGYTSL